CNRCSIAIYHIWWFIHSVSYVWCRTSFEHFKEDKGYKMSKVSKILFCGGGTGGHIYPALAVADYLKAKKQDIEMVFVGTKQGLEAKIVPQHGYKIEFIEV